MAVQYSMPVVGKKGIKQSVACLGKGGMVDIPFRYNWETQLERERPTAPI
jgi:hypothetical protein